MPTYHLDISIGPVGDFIAGGRRSRDLWWGSTWVSECTRAVALALAERDDVQLVVPSPKRLDEIDEIGLLDAFKDPALGRRFHGGRIANHIRATVEAESSAALATLVASLKTTAHKHLADILAACKTRGESRIGTARFAQLVDLELWDRQLAAVRSGDFLELGAAWALDAKRAGRLLAASKSTRRFGAPAGDASGRPKSHLDLGRDSVLRKDLHQVRGSLGLGHDEQLDAIGLARRIAAFAEDDAPKLPVLPFPPISRVAVDPWLATVERHHGDTLKRLQVALHRARNDDTFSLWCSAAVDPEHDLATPREQQTFPFDASLLLEDGPATLRALVTRTFPGHPQDHLNRVAEHVRVLHAARGLGPPPGYYALLAADGDRVGQVLDQLHKHEVPHLVDALDEFADAAARHICQHHGRAFFTGGDDVLAYVPVDVLLWHPGDGDRGLLEDLADLFDRHVNGALARLGKAPDASLSFGVAIAHVKDDLRAVRRSAQDALDDAKRHKGPSKAGPALSIRERVRSGEERSCTGMLAGLASDLRHWVDLCHIGELSQRSAHHLLELHAMFSTRHEDDADDDGGGHLGLALARASESLRRRRRDAEPGPAAPLALRLKGLQTWRDVRTLAHELLLAERILPVRRLRLGVGLTAQHAP